MEEYDLSDVSVKELYDTYLKIKILIDELNGKKKELPPKEEL